MPHSVQPRCHSWCGDTRTEKSPKRALHGGVTMRPPPRLEGCLLTLVADSRRPTERRTSSGSRVTERVRELTEQVQRRSGNPAKSAQDRVKPFGYVSTRSPTMPAWTAATIGSLIVISEVETSHAADQQRLGVTRRERTMALW